MAEYSIYKNSASYLYQALIPEPLLSGISELIIIPDAAFSSISFDALITGPNQENVMNLYRTEPYLLRKYALGYSFSSTFLVRSLNKDFPLRKSFIGFAPDYSNSRDSLVNIPEGITHVKKLAGMFFGKAIRGTDATENRFKNSGGYNMINFYTHGIDDTLNAARSKMYFCQEGDTLDDGYLYSYEISSMQLHTNLVTLVTCYSGAGELLKGEGVMSIGRSFANAGSPAMVISLWMASAVSSHQIMKEFYRELLRGKTKSVALQSAKLKYIEKTSPMGANPKIWSGLVLYGNQEALFRNFILKVYVVPAIVVLGLGLLFILVYRRMRKDRSLKRRNYNQD
jgi:CHAT domain-containing protein